LELLLLLLVMRGLVFKRGGGEKVSLEDDDAVERIDRQD
jgi:hypothetical protein